MKVLHVSSRDCSGGAGRAAYRLHQSLLAHGVDSKILARRKASNDPGVTVSGEECFGQNVLEKATPPIERLVRRWTGNTSGSHWSFSLIPNFLARQINRSDAEVVHLHWVGDGYLPIWSLPRIRKPVVWTLHDLWPILGVGHYDDADPSGKGKIAVDWEGMIGEIKRKVMGELPIQVVGPSPWVISEMKRRGERPGWAGTVIPYGLDTSVFRPLQDTGLGEQLGVDPDKPVLVFGAMGATTSPRKGADLLEKVLEKLASRRSDLQIIVFGDRPGDSIAVHGFPVFRMGSVNDDSQLAEIYSLGDVFLFPSREETFGQTASESLACGTPVVGFRAAGQQSVFEHRAQGYLAEPYNPSDLAEGVEWVIQEGARGRSWTNECRKFALAHYTLQNYANAHRELYQRVLAR